MNHNAGVIAGLGAGLFLFGVVVSGCYTEVGTVRETRTEEYAEEEATAYDDSADAAGYDDARARFYEDYYYYYPRMVIAPPYVTFGFGWGAYWDPYPYWWYGYGPPGWYPVYWGGYYPYPYSWYGGYYHGYYPGYYYPPTYAYRPVSTSYPVGAYGNTRTFGTTRTATGGTGTSMQSLPVAGRSSTAVRPSGGTTSRNPGTAVRSGKETERTAAVGRSKTSTTGSGKESYRPPRRPTTGRSDVPQRYEVPQYTPRPSSPPPSSGGTPRRAEAPQRGADRPASTPSYSPPPSSSGGGHSAPAPSNTGQRGGGRR